MSRARREPSVPSVTAAPLDEQRLHGALARLPSLAGDPRTVERLEGGLTNLNFKVTTPEDLHLAELILRDRHAPS